MKSKWIFRGFVISGALFAFNACQKTDGNPTGNAEVTKNMSEQQKLGYVAPGTSPANSPVEIGEKALEPSDAELKQFLSSTQFKDSIGSQPSIAKAQALLKRQAISATQSGTCLIDFNSSSSLNLIQPNHAGSTFVWEPWYVEYCYSDAQAYVEPMNDNHYHLGYENPYLCFAPGKNPFSDINPLGLYTSLPTLPSPPNCLASIPLPTCNPINADPAWYPRFLAPHVGNDWIRTYVLNGDGTTQKTFDLKSIWEPLEIA